MVLEVPSGKRLIAFSLPFVFSLCPLRRLIKRVYSGVPFFFFFFLPRCPAPLLYVFSAWFLTVGSCCCKMAFSTSALPLCETVQNVPIPEHGWTLLFDLIKNVCLNLFRYLTCSTSKQLQLHLAFMISSTSLKSTISLSYQK